MKKCLVWIVLAVGLGVGIGYYGTRYAQKSCCARSSIVNEKHCALRRAMDKLWIQHVLWTRQVVVSAIAKLGDLDVAIQRLLQNQDDIGNAVIPYYGQEAGKQLAKLLREHITIAADIIKATLAKDTETAKKMNIEWHRNADDIAQFLYKANPNNWNDKDLQSMLYEHLALLTTEITLRINHDWSSGVANFNDVLNQAIMMAQDLADGIVKQFPEKF